MKTVLTTIACLCAAIALGDVTGKVTLSSGRAAKQAVVWIEGTGVRAKPVANALIDQRGKKFLPHVIAVPVGTTVSFPNDDYVYHNVFAEYDAKRFDLGMYPRGSTKRQRFDKAGLVALFCSVHSDMSAFVMVVDSPFYAVTDASGHFSLKNVPSGTYTLKAWHESGEMIQEKVRITDGQKLEVQTKKS